MKIILGKLYLTFSECLIQADTLYKAAQRNSKCFVFVTCPTQGRMVQYEALKDEYKAAIILKYGCCPIEWYKNHGFESRLTTDTEAWSFYSAYRFDDNKVLPAEHINRYVTIASVFNAVIKDRTCLEEALEYMKAKNLKPCNKDRFTRTLAQYKASLSGRLEGLDYGILISGKFGNQCAAKEKNLPLLRQLAARPNNFDHAIIANDYNQLAVANGLPVLSQSTVYRIATKSETQLQILGWKRGLHAWRNSFDVVVGRKRPDHPLCMTNHDGHDWELYYQKPFNTGSRVEIRHHYRKVVMVVIDAYNDYILGYAIGDQENAELIKAGLKSAALHIKELTGAYHLQWEIKSDRFALEGLKPFYGKIAPHITPGKAKNARDKVIESFFKRFDAQWTCRNTPNYAGHNIDSAKRNQPNRDFLNKYKSYFPDEAGVCQQIAADIERDRQAKREAWLTGWANTPAEMKRPVSREQYLEIFGIEREKTVQLTNQGLTVISGGIKRNYLLLEHDFIGSIGTDIQVTFDPESPESILAHDLKNRRKWLVNEVELMPMARVCQKEGDRTRLNEVLEFKKEVEQNMIAANAEDMNALEAEGLNKGFFTYNNTNKHIQQQAKHILGQANIKAIEEAPVEDELDKVYVKKGSFKVIEE